MLMSLFTRSFFFIFRQWSG